MTAKSYRHSVKLCWQRL